MVWKYVFEAAVSACLVSSVERWSWFRFLEHHFQWCAQVVAATWRCTSVLPSRLLLWSLGQRHRNHRIWSLGHRHRNPRAVQTNGRRHGFPAGMDMSLTSGGRTRIGRSKTGKMARYGLLRLVCPYVCHHTSSNSNSSSSSHVLYRSRHGSSSSSSSSQQ